MAERATHLLRLPRLDAWPFVRRRTVPGTAPGTLTPDPDAHPPTIHLIGYGPDGHAEEDGVEPGTVVSWRGRWPVLWVNVTGLADVEVIREMGRHFDLHHLALEDVVNVHQRPKVEQYADHWFIVTRMPTPAETVETEQVSIFLGNGFVLTFQERPGDCFEPIRQRIRSGGSRVLRHGGDYLAYLLLDAVVDGYFPLLEAFGERMERLEVAVVEGQARHPVAEIYAMKREMLSLRRGIWPQRDALHTLQRDPGELIQPETRVHLRDCYDHTFQIIDLLETYREIASNLMDVHMSVVGNRMNEIMKVLTIFASIFIPLTFIAGVYGMNFDPAASPWNMPELAWRYGYPATLLLMAGVVVMLLLFFRRRGWLGGR
jgi:magnesium transporter